MKKQGRDDTTSIHLSTPKGSSSGQVCHDCQKVAFKMYPGNGHKNGDQLTSRDATGKFSSVPHIIPSRREQKYDMRDEMGHRNSRGMMNSSCQACSGPEDDSTDPPETLTETSTMTFVDAHTTQESVESHSLHGLGMIYLKDFVLIDDDEDGDMSLREKTVTDLSVVDGKAADLVCGRLLSTSSGSLSEYKEESSAREPPLPEEDDPARQKKGCCFCTLL